MLTVAAAHIVGGGGGVCQSDAHVDVRCGSVGGSAVRSGFTGCFRFRSSNRTGAHVALLPVFPACVS